MVYKRVQAREAASERRGAGAIVGAQGDAHAGEVAFGPLDAAVGLEEGERVGEDEAVVGGAAGVDDEADVDEVEGGVEVRGEGALHVGDVEVDGWREEGRGGELRRREVEAVQGRLRVRRAWCG